MVFLIFLFLYHDTSENESLLTRIHSERLDSFETDSPQHEEDHQSKVQLSHSDADAINYPTFSLQSTSHTQLDAFAAIASNDMRKVKEELILLVSRYESLKLANAKLLYKLLCSRGNLQVCCRIRPRNDQELANGAKTCLEVVDEAEIACFDKLVVHSLSTYHILGELFLGGLFNLIRFGMNFPPRSSPVIPNPS